MRHGKYASGSDEVLFSSSGNLPAWAKDNPELYWSAADEYERANGRLFTQIEFALPRELNPEQQKALAEEFCRAVTGDMLDGKTLPFSYAIHKGEYNHKGEYLGQPNPHVHLMISERALDGLDRSAETWFKRANSKHPERGGAAKWRTMKATSYLEWVRETLAIYSNNHLSRAGHDARIDHRTLKEQGILRKPGTHNGVGKWLNVEQVSRDYLDSQIKHREEVAALFDLQKPHVQRHYLEQAGGNRDKAEDAIYAACEAMRREQERQEQERQRQEQEREQRRREWAEFEAFWEATRGDEYLAQRDMEEIYRQARAMADAQRAANATNANTGNAENATERDISRKRGPSMG